MNVINLYNIGMYLRRVTRKNKDGSQVAYLQLAQNEWDPKAKYAKAMVIYSFGREDQVDRAVLERLVRSITRFLSPEEALRAQEGIGEAADFLFKASKPLGGTWTLHQIWNKLGLDEIFKELLQNRHYETNIERLIFAMVSNRALDLSSKRAMENWVRDDVVILILKKCPFISFTVPWIFCWKHGNRLKNKCMMPLRIS